MKRIAYLLAVMLLLTACTAQNEMPSAQSSAPVEEVFSDPGGQQMAIDAYSAILESFGVGSVPGIPEEEWYPEGFSGAYIGDDNFLYVCLTDTSEEILEHYRSAVPEPRILNFVEVEHSYKDLYALSMALV